MATRKRIAVCVSFLIGVLTLDSYLSFHIRAAGDWTRDFIRLLNPEKKLGLVCEDMMFAPNGAQIMRVDGGFGGTAVIVLRVCV